MGMVELPLVRREILIGGCTFAVETVEDEDALLAAAEGRHQFPFGLMLWESAIALAEVVAAQPDLVSGKSVLELGCGIGLAGVVASSLGGRVLATDHDAVALQAARRTARLNGAGGFDTALGDWHDWRVAGRFDLILGADVTFDPADHSALQGVLERMLAPGGRVLLADPGRAARAAFAERAAGAGWTLTRSLRRVDDIKRKGASIDAVIELMTRKRVAAG